MNRPEAIWIVGGEQRCVPHWTREWKLYKKGLVVRASDGKLQRVLEHALPYDLQVPPVAGGARQT